MTSSDVGPVSGHFAGMEPLSRTHPSHPTQQEDQ